MVLIMIHILACTWLSLAKADDRNNWLASKLEGLREGGETFEEGKSYHH